MKTTSDTERLLQELVKMPKSQHLQIGPDYYEFEDQETGKIFKILVQEVKEKVKKPGKVKLKIGPGSSKCSCGIINKPSDSHCLCGKQLREVTEEKQQIPKKSEKRTKEDVYYYKARKEFLSDNPCCSVETCHNKAVDLHHMKGRVGYADQWARDNGIKLYWDKRYFKGLCRGCHSEIEADPTKAKAEGYSVSRHQNEDIKG